VTTRILIVDDHPLTREALSSLLGAHGFDVVGCSCDGAQAIVDAGRLQPDLVLLDLSMPGLDGLTALPWEPEHFVLSFHGLPQKYAQSGDPYATHCVRTARALVARMKREFPRVVEVKQMYEGLPTEAACKLFCWGSL
jgi:hypothetical protein